MRQLTVYPWHTGKLARPVRLLVISDLHDAPYADLLPLLTGADALLMPGDVVNRYRQGYAGGLSMVREAARILPTFVGMGNHEYRLRELAAFQAAVADTGAQMLSNRYVRLGQLVIGCWYRPEDLGQTDMLRRMEAEDGCRVLMCHRPEDYVRRLQGAQMDLVLAGHAHGGQVRVLGQGLYAPGQGLFPRYTHGVHGRMIISAGAANAVLAPRWGNPCEVLRIDLD